MAEKRQKKKKRHRLFWFMIKLQLLLMVLVLGAIGYYYLGGYARQVEELHEKAVELVLASDEKMFIPSQTSVVYDINGQVISERTGEKEAEYVVYEDIPANYIAAVISIEDKKFYKHNGVDIKAVFRAVKAMIINGKVTQGGSTISMQLAKLMFMETGNKTWQYKVEQMFIAIELEKRYTKSQIMEFYLNNIYFANGYYGIGAACHGYFNCELSELDISQIAFLMSIPNGPTYYDPLVHMDHTITRRDLILQNLWEDGRITDERYYSALAEEIVLNQPQKTGTLWNNYVDTYVYQCATQAMMENSGFPIKYYFDSKEEQAQYEEKYDELYALMQKELYTGGYKIYTSIDMQKQNLLQQSLDEALSDNTETGENGVYSLQGAAVCIDNSNGHVCAIVGGRSQDFSTYTLNRAYQSHRQPGSSIKPLIVYTPCFEREYTPDSVMEDYQFEGGPSNAGDAYYGEVTLRTAVAKSLNTVAWQLYEELTPEVGLQYLKDMNFSNIVDSDYVLPTSIGGFTTGVSALEMAAGYATIANDGLYRTPTCIMQIVDADENVIYQSEQIETVIYEETASRMMTDVLQTVMLEGTGRDMVLDNGIVSAGKTGTTNNYKDGWFVGYTRYYTTSVWVGYDIPKMVDTLSKDKYPGKIWQNYMNQIHEGLANLDFLPYAKLSQEYLDSLAPGENPEAQQPEEDDNGEVQPEENGNGEVQPEENGNGEVQPEENGNGAETLVEEDDPEEQIPESDENQVPIE